MSSLGNQIVAVITGAAVSLITLGINYALSKHSAKQALRRSVMLRLQAARIEVWVVQNELRTNEIMVLAFYRDIRICKDDTDSDNDRKYYEDEFKYYRKLAETYKIRATKAMKDFHSLLVEADRAFNNNYVSDLCDKILLLNIPEPEEPPIQINTHKEVSVWIDNQKKNIQATLNSNLLNMIDRLNQQIRALITRTTPVRDNPTYHRATRIGSFVKGILFTIKTTLED